MNFINRVSMLLEVELWHDVVGYENKYEVSNFGRVKSLNYRGNTGTEQILKPVTDRYGYLYVELWKDGKGKKFKIHRLVAQAFLDDYSEELQANHRNGCKTDNTLSNLEMVTGAENIRHACENGLRHDKKPVRIANDEEELIFDSVKGAAEYIGCHHQNVSACARGKIKKCKGYTVEYINTDNESEELTEYLDSKVS